MADNELTSDPWDDLGSPTPEGTDPESPASPIQPPTAESTDVHPGPPPTPPPPPASPGLAEPEAPVVDIDPSVSDDFATAVNEIPSDPAGADQSDPGVSDLAAPDLAVGEFGVPELGVPELDVPELDVPELNVPELNVPELNVPELGVPDLEIPDLDLPDLDAAHGLEIPDLDFGETATAPALSAEPEAPLEQLDAPAEVTDRSTRSRYSPLLAATGLFGDNSPPTDESAGSEAAEGAAPEAIETALADEDTDDFQLGSSGPPSVYGELEDIAGIGDGETNLTDEPVDEPAVGRSDEPSSDPSWELEESEGPSDDLQVDESGGETSAPQDEAATEGDEEAVADSSDDSAMDFAALLGGADAIGLGGDEPDLAALAALVADVEPVVMGEDSATPILEDIASKDTDDWLVDADDLSDDEAGFDIGITWGSGEETVDAEEDATAMEDGPPDLEVPDLEVPDLDVPDLDVPDLDVPEVEIPEDALAELGGHDVGIPDLETPDTDVPESDMPESDMLDWPNAETPDTDVPEGDMPESDMPDWPNAETPDTDVPEGDMPESDMPDWPNAETPGTDVPESDMPESDMPDWPEADVPEADVPEADVPELDRAVGDVPEVDMLGMVGTQLDAPDSDSAEPYQLESDSPGDAIAFSDVDSSSEEEAVAGASPVRIFDELEDVSAESMLSGDGEAWGARWREAAQGWVEDESGASTWRPIITTSPTLSEWDVDTYLGVVIGDTSTDADEVTAEGVAAARETSTRHMVDEALARGAHAVVGVTYTVQPIGATVLVTATGTAVTLKAESSS